MTEKRFQYIRGKYSHGVHDTVKDGEYKKGYRTTYDEFDLDKLTDELNIRENKIKQLEKENKKLKQVIKIIDEMISVEKSNIFRCLYEEDKYEPEIRIDALEKLKKELQDD